MADLTRDELDRLLASYAASGSTGWIVDIARMARASLDMVPAADFDAHGAALFERTISRRARRWEAFGRRVWRQYGAICAAMTRHHEDAERAWLEHVEWLRKERDEARREGEAYARAAIAESLDATRAIAAQRDVALTERDEARRELAAAEESARMYAERGAKWQREAEQARRELGEVREVLRGVEWSGPVDYVSTARDVTIYRAAGRRLKTPRKETQHSRIPSSACPVCGGVKPLDSIPPYDRYVTPVGHTADCSLAAALGKERWNE